MKYKNKATPKFRSKLEKACGDLLKESGLEYYYEPFKIPIVPEFEYNNDSGERIGKGKQFIQQRKKVQRITYTPDFTSSPILSKDMGLIETKGYPTPSFVLKWKLLKQYLHHNNYNGTLFMPNNVDEIKFCIDKILKCGN